MIYEYGSEKRRLLSRRGGMRKVKQWRGKTVDDDKIPLQVQLRVLLKQGGRCAITGHKFMVGRLKEARSYRALGRWRTAPRAKPAVDSRHTEHKAKTAEEAPMRARARSFRLPGTRVSSAPARSKSRTGSASANPISRLSARPPFKRRFEQ